jgi:hypothetical protein
MCLTINVGLFFNLTLILQVDVPIAMWSQQDYLTPLDTFAVDSRDKANPNHLKDLSICSSH